MKCGIELPDMLITPTTFRRCGLDTVEMRSRYVSVYILTCPYIPFFWVKWRQDIRNVGNRARFYTVPSQKKKL
jgi:hypothetical protein